MVKTSSVMSKMVSLNVNIAETKNYDHRHIATWQPITQYQQFC